MKKDLVLLAITGLLVAIALAVAIARRAVPTPQAFNPLASWPGAQVATAFVLALVASILSIAAIGWSDRGLSWPSATLEWVYSSTRAEEIVSDYGDARAKAVRGVLLDSIAFIPSYVLLIAISAFWIARGWGSEPWSMWTVAVGWIVVFAGAFDWLENAGILATLGGLTKRLAPLTYGACQLKWILVCVAADFTLIAFAMRGAGR